MKIRNWIPAQSALLAFSLSLLQLPRVTALAPGATGISQNAALLARRDQRHQPHAFAHGGGEHKQNGEQKVNVWTGVLMAGIAGVSTVLGATVVVFMPEGGPPPSAMAFSFSLAAGVMLAVSVEMLLPHKNEGAEVDQGKIGFAWTPFLVFSFGAICCALLCKLADCFEATAAADSENGEVAKPDNEKKSFRLAILLFVALTLHNFPEGFAVAVSAMSGLRLGVTICVAVACHNIPEGIALAVSVYGATKSYGQSFFWTFISGLSEPLGAMCAVLLLQSYVTSSPDLLTHLLTAVAGVMCYVAVAELLPEAISTACWASIVTGFITGVAVMVLTHWVIDTSIEAGHIEMRQH